GAPAGRELPRRRRSPDPQARAAGPRRSSQRRNRPAPPAAPADAASCPHDLHGREAWFAWATSLRYPYAPVNRPGGVLWIGTAVGFPFWWLATKYRCGRSRCPRWPATPRRGKPRERLGCQSLLRRDPAQQDEQLLALLTGQAGRDAGLMLGGDGPHPRQHRLARPGQVQRVRPPVGGIAPALDQPQPLQLVHQEDHLGGVDPPQRGDRLPRLALVGR